MIFFFIFFFLQQSARRWERSFPQPSRMSCWLVTPHCSAESSPFLRAGASQAAALGWSRGAEQLLLCFVPNPGGWILAVGLPNTQILRCVVPLAPCSPRAGVVRSVAFFFLHALYSGGDGLRWHGSRGNPLLARKPDAWSHCLPLPGKAGRASAGVSEQHAGAAGWAQAALEGPPEPRRGAPQPGTAATNQTCGGASSPAPSSLGLNRSKEAAGWRGFPPPPRAFHLLSNVAARAGTRRQQTAVTDGRS